MRWPSYFELAWADLQPVIATPAYDQTLGRIHERFVAAALCLPNPTGATANQLRNAAAEAAPISEVLSMVQLFQNLLPGLIANVAFFRAQLQEC